MLSCPRCMYSLCHMLLAIMIFLTIGIPGQTGQVEEQEPDTDILDYVDFDAAGTLFQFKFEIGPGSRECFFQKMKSGAQLVVAFEVCM